MKKLIPKYQKGKKSPNTFIGAAVDAAGGDSEIGDIISSLASIHPQLAIGLGMLDLGYDANGVYHGDKYAKDIGLDILGLIPFVKAARFNLLKKDGGWSYLKAQLRKKYGNKLNKGLFIGKGIDILDDIFGK